MVGCVIAMGDDESIDPYLKLFRGFKIRHMGWRTECPSEAMVFDLRRFRRWLLISKDRAQTFLSAVFTDWTMIGELTFADELSGLFDTSVLPIGVAAQEISFHLTGAKVHGHLDRLIFQVRPRLLIEELSLMQIEYVTNICNLGEAVSQYDREVLSADEFFARLNSIRSTHPQINFYLFEVIRSYRHLFPFETLKPIYDHLKVQFSDENPPFQYAKSEHRNLLRQWIRLERKNAAKLALRDKGR